MQFDTIVAIATPVGMGSVGIVRLSGENALKIGQILCPNITIKEARHVYLSLIIHPKTQQVIDEACVIYFKGPHSYTGEDCVEIQTHGSYFILQKVLAVCVECGARLALPGEFTRQAFLNGKIELTQAESIGDLIHADSEKSHAVALSHVQGKLYTYINTCRDQLCRIFEQIEGSIDFPDEVDGINREAVIQMLDQNCEQLQKMITFQDIGETVKRGINCVIVGKPNVGKSALFNQLVGKERAIVTDIAGTTRDYLTESFQLGGMIVNLYDTAGIRETADYIEHLGIKKITDLLKNADCIFWVIDSNQALSKEDYAIFEKIKAESLCVLLANKADLTCHVDMKAIQYPKQWQKLEISAKTAAGIDQVKQFLYDQFIQQVERIDLALLCNVRQLNCIQVALTAMQQMKNGLRTGVEDDIISVDLKQAILKLGEVTGAEFTEETLDRIFSRFCVGK